MAGAGDRLDGKGKEAMSMSVVREPASAQTAPAPIAQPRFRLSRVVAILAVAGLAILGGYQLMLIAVAVKAAAVAAWTAGAPALGQAWAALQAMWHTVSQAILQAH
jgi:hypothetical protein